MTTSRCPLAVKLRPQTVNSFVQGRVEKSHEVGVPRDMEGGGTDVAIRKNLLDRLLNSVKQVERNFCSYLNTTKGGGVFADSAIMSALTYLHCVAIAIGEEILNLCN